MGKIILFDMLSLDGFFEGPGGSLDWHNVDEEFQTFAIEQLDAAAGLLFGRVTFDFMAAFWPGREALELDPMTAERMNGLPKFVFSRAGKMAEWSNSRMVGEVVPEKLRAMKAESPKDLLLLGSAVLTESLAACGLIDEYRLMINPVILGAGRPLFSKTGGRQALGLIAARSFGNGNVLLSYRGMR